MVIHLPGLFEEAEKNVKKGKGEDHFLTLEGDVRNLCVLIYIKTQVPLLVYYSYSVVL